MTATTVPRKTPRRNSAYDMKWDPLVKTSTVLYEGVWAGLDTNGEAVPADEASVVLGRVHCENGVSATGDGSARVRIDQGIFAWVSGTGVDALPPGSTVYAADNQTTSIDPDDGPVGGQLIEVDDEGAWVLSGFTIPIPGGV